MDGRATRTSRYRGWRMFTDVHGDMGCANLPNVHSDEHDLRVKQR